jgi:hypothetical protein
VDSGNFFCHKSRSSSSAFAKSGPSGQPQAGAAASAPDGLGSLLSQAPLEHSRSGGGPLSLPTEGLENHSTRLGLVRGHHLRGPAGWVRLSGRDHGLVQPLCAGLGSVSNSMESAFCVSALERALSRRRRPEIHNTDQGSQFTSADWLSLLERHAFA